MPKLGPGDRARIGAAVLAAAEVVDTQPVQRRLTSFAVTHRLYMNGQQAAAVAAAPLAAAQRRLAQGDRKQDHSITRLAAALLFDGQPRANPFRGLGVPSPSAMQRLPVAKEAAAIHRLVAVLRHREGTSARTWRMAQAADAAATAVERVLAEIVKLHAAVRTAMLARDAIGKTWDRDLAALRRATRAAVADGAPLLHQALFGPGRRAGGTY